MPVKSQYSEPGVVAQASIPAFRRQRQVDLCELDASLVYRVSSKIARATGRKLASKKQNKTKSVFRGTGEMAQQKALTALAEDPGLVFTPT